MDVKFVAKAILLIILTIVLFAGLYFVFKSFVG